MYVCIGVVHVYTCTCECVYASHPNSEELWVLQMQCQPLMCVEGSEGGGERNGVIGKHDLRGDDDIP